jgi:hypothetical protein
MPSFLDSRDIRQAARYGPGTPPAGGHDFLPDLCQSSESVIRVLDQQRGLDTLAELASELQALQEHVSF